MEYIEIYDKKQRKIAVLDKAVKVTEDLRLNGVSCLTFALAFDDHKNDFCAAYNYAKWGGRLYRILPSTLSISTAGTIEYKCEHVITTLLDNPLNGHHVVGNAGVYTSDVIRYVLDHQRTKNWILGECDFCYQFEYGWERVSLLNALLSIPKVFEENYIFQFDTNTYPWVLSLKKLDKNKNPEMYIWNRKNMLSLSRKSDPEKICTRLYPYGYGEGINQLTIHDVNGGLEYIDSPQEYIDKYGIIEKIWVDRSYENAQSLMEAARSVLNRLQEPAIEYSVSFAELSQDYFDIADVGKVVQIVDTRTNTKYRSYITSVKRTHGDKTSSTMTIANRPDDVASSVATLADKIRIGDTYAQGATNLFAQSIQDNADASTPLELNFYIPREMRIINKIEAKVKLARFRAYSQATDYGGGSTQTSSSGGGTQTSSSSGGGGVTSSSSGGGTQTTTSTDGEKSRTSSAGGATTSEQSAGMSDTGMTEAATREGDPHYHRFSFYLLRHTHRIGSHTHTVSIPSHAHTVSVSSHSHTVNVPSHTHTISISPHTHSVDIPGHSHGVAPGIFRFGNPGGFTLICNGAKKAVYATRDETIDLTQHLIGDDGKIRRGSWQSIGILPDDLAHISLDMFVQGFVQSRGDATV